MLKKNWYPFIVGLLDGDGSIQVNHWKEKYLQYRIMIKLKNHSENVIMLKKIQKLLKCGRILLQKDYVLWIVNNKNEISHLIKIFDKYPFLTFNTATRFKWFKTCFENNFTYAQYKISKQQLIKDLNPSQIKMDQQIDDNYFNSWLLGFIEAEGCFSIRKNGIKSFSIGQVFGWEIIKKIKKMFDLPNKIREISDQDRVFVYIETYNQESLKKIITFIKQDKISLQGYKLTQYQLFANTLK